VLKIFRKKNNPGFSGLGFFCYICIMKSTNFEIGLLLTIFLGCGLCLIALAIEPLPSTFDQVALSLILGALTAISAWTLLRLD